MLGYDDFFMSLDKVMVRTDASGKYAALTMDEYSRAKYAGRLSPGDSASGRAVDPRPLSSASGCVLCICASTRSQNIDRHAIMPVQTESRILPRSKRREFSHSHFAYGTCAWPCWGEAERSCDFRRCLKCLHAIIQ